MSHYFLNDKNVKSNKKIIKIKLNNNSYSFFTDNGVFSKGGLDFGTRTLLESLAVQNLTGKILDVGCGYGPIGIVMASLSSARVTMADINERALDLAKENIELNKVKNIEVLKSDIYSNIKDKYNYIITNPPIRVGKEILYKFLFEAKDFLIPDGKLIFVINKNQGAKSLIENLKKEYDIEIITKNKGFYIVCCKNR